MNLESYLNNLPVSTITQFFCQNPCDLIIIAETKLNLKFSKEYNNYLRKYGAVILDNHEITGICDIPRLNVINVTKEERKYNPFVPDDWYVIEQANIDGIVIWQNQVGEIYQTFPNGTIIKIADSLCDYILLSNSDSYTDN